MMQTQLGRLTYWVKRNFVSYRSRSRLMKVCWNNSAIKCDLMGAGRSCPRLLGSNRAPLESARLRLASHNRLAEMLAFGNV
ncbi:unnamed protein product, partial [Nesidiocoris tenuis]